MISTLFTCLPNSSPWPTQDDRLVYGHLALLLAEIMGVCLQLVSFLLLIHLLIRDHLHGLGGSQHGQLLRVHVYIDIYSLVMTRVVVEGLACSLSLLLFRRYLYWFVKTFDFLYAYLFRVCFLI